MSSLQVDSQNLHEGTTPSQSQKGVSWLLILGGLISIVLALVMFLYAKTYSPKQKQYVFEGRIERIPPAGTSASVLFRSPAPSDPAPFKQQQHAGRHPPSSTRRVLLGHQSARRDGQPCSSVATAQSEIEALKPERASYQDSGFSSINLPFLPVSFSTIVSQQRVPESFEGLLPDRDSQPVLAEEPGTLQAEQSDKQQKPNVLRRFFRWLSGLFKRKKAPRNHPPVISSVTLSQTTVVVKPHCPKGSAPDAGRCALSESRVVVKIVGTDADGDEINYKPIAEAGRFSSIGSTSVMNWDLEGVAPGVYELKVLALDGKSETESGLVRLIVKECDCKATGCVADIKFADTVKGDKVTLVGEVDGPSSEAASYVWSVIGGRIVSGQGTNSITVDTAGVRGGRVEASLMVTVGPDTVCGASAFFSISAGTMPNRALITGTVTDSAGAVVANASVVIIGRGGLRRQTVTNDAGEYRFEGLEPGTYEMEVAASGFALMRVSGVSTESGRTDVSLSPGRIDGQVTVTAGKGKHPVQASPPDIPENTIKKQDEIRVSYPERFLEDRESDVTFELEEVLREVVPSQSSIGGTAFVVAKPDPIPGVKPDEALSQAYAGYEAFATVQLIQEGLIVTSKPDELQRLLGGELVNWMWRVKPAADAGEECSFMFRVDVVWKPRDAKLPEKIHENVWSHQPFKVPVGPPLPVELADKGFPVPLGAGAVALGVGAYPRRRRREEIGETAADAVEAAVEDEVSSTVYSPAEAQPGDAFLVQVFIHLLEQAEGLDEIAKEADEEARRRITSKLKQKIKRGTELAFHLSMPGLEIDEPAQSCVWEGEPVWVQFAVTVPPDHKPKNIIGTVIVSENTIPLGHLKFKFRIGGAVAEGVPAMSSQPSVAANLIRYKQAFISYASKDRGEVLKRVQMLNVVKLKFFQDLLTLEPGDSWEHLIYKYIDESDVFFLFWSQAASESDWVKKEVAYAIRRKAASEEAPPEIVPVIIEGPPAAKPPEELSHLHFNDKFIYFMNTKDSRG